MWMFCLGPGRFLRSATQVAALLLLTSCATVPPLVPEAERGQAWQRHQTALAALQTWSLNGRVRVDSDKDSWRAEIRWEQAGDTYDIALNTLLGQGAALLHGDAHGVSLRTVDKQTLVAQTPEKLLRDMYGWDLPLSHLRYWLRGLPMPAQAAEQGLDEQGRLSWLEQGGWHVAFTSYRQVAGQALPNKVQLESQTMKVRLVIDQWTLP